MQSECGDTVESVEGYSMYRSFVCREYAAHAGAFRFGYSTSAMQSGAAAAVSHALCGTCGR